MLMTPAVAREGRLRRMPDRTKNMRRMGGGEAVYLGE